MKRIAILVSLLMVALAAIGADTGCSPAARDRLVEEVKRAAPQAIPSLERGACVLLRKITDDGTVSDVCVGADLLAPILAPIVDDLVSQKKDARAQGATVAFALPVAYDPPKKTRPKRHCVEWVEVSPVASSSKDDTPYRDASADAP